MEDELLVVLDLYLENRRVLEEHDPRVVAASELLNRLPIHAQAGTPGFRTPDAVVLRMANYRSYDPSTAAKGMSNAGRRAGQVWRRYADDPAAVGSLVASIQSIATNPRERSEASSHMEPEESEIPEGRLIYRLHRRRERDPKLRARKFAQLTGAGVQPSCESCCLVPEAIFGTGTSQVLECHHLQPLRLGERTTRLADVVLLCANCHKALHAKGLLASVQGLRDGLPAQFRSAMQLRATPLVSPHNAGGTAREQS